MPFGLRCRLLDLAFVTALLLAAAVPVLCLRASPLLYRPATLTASALVLGALVTLWALFAQRAQTAVPCSCPPGPERSAGWHTASIALLLGAVVLVGFCYPLRIHFWAGADEFLNFQDRELLQWMHDWDVAMNRPFTVLTCAVGQALSPGRIDGFLWLGTALCWVNALLLFALLRELLPQSRLLPAAAGVLLIVDRSEPTRFLVMFTSNNYLMALGFLLLGVWLFLRSARLGSRPLLALACASLGATLLMFEAAYPLAALAPVLAWFRRAQRRQLAVWAYAWCGTLALFATRFLLFLSQRGAEAYQSAQLSGVLRNPRMLWNNLKLHLKAGLANFQFANLSAGTWTAAVAVLALTVALITVAARRGQAPRRPRSLMICAIAAAALLLGTLPFLPLPFVFRTQFFAAPGLAALLAGGLCLAGSLLGRRAGQIAVAAAVSLFAANATNTAISAQRRERLTAAVNFERTVHIYRQIHGICPQPAPDTLILLVPEQRLRAPLGCNYSCLDLAPRVLGAKLVQTGVRDGVLPPPVFGADAVTVGSAGTAAHTVTPYDKVLAFRVAADGTVALLRRLPERLLPAENSAVRYDPLALLRPGPVAEMRYLRYPSWARRPRDLFDMSDGVLLGAGWGPLECRDSTLARRAAAGAELVVNPLGQTHRELHLRVDGGASGRLEAVDLAGKVVASADFDCGGEVSLRVPTDPARVGLIRLRLSGGDGGFQAVCPGGKVSDFAPPPPAPADIVAEDIELGANWHALETHRGETWRWVANDAELILSARPAPGAYLLLDVEAGPGMGREPCRLTVADQSGRVLGTACVRSRETLRLPLPPGSNAGTILRLHAEGGGRVTASDWRVMNFRLFRGALQSD